MFVVLYKHYTYIYTLYYLLFILFIHTFIAINSWETDRYYEYIIIYKFVFVGLGTTNDELILAWPSSL